MDYSVLLVVEQLSNKQLQPPKVRNQFSSENQIVHIGIIDYLQDWTLKKKAENFFKSNRLSISAVNPKLYETRMVKFMEREVFRRQIDSE